MTVSVWSYVLLTTPLWPVSVPSSHSVPHSLYVLLLCCGMPLSEVWHNWALTGDTRHPGPGVTHHPPLARSALPPQLWAQRIHTTHYTDSPEYRVRSYLNTRATPSINFIAICPTHFSLPWFAPEVVELSSDRCW